MNSRATSVMAWRLHCSAIAACLVYFRKFDPTAFWEFCNTICQNPTVLFGAVPSVQSSRVTLLAIAKASRLLGSIHLPT